MKVIQISNFFADFRGSFINQLELLADNIKKSGGECTFIFPNQAKELSWCIDLKMRHKIYFISGINWRTRNLVNKELTNIFNIVKPDVIHSHFDGYDVSITISAAKDVQKIYHRHNEFDLSNLPLFKKIYALLIINYKMLYLRNKGYSIFISNEMCNNFINKGYIIKKKAVVVFNGISTKTFENVKVTKQRFDKPVIFSLIGNWHTKGGDIILEAVKFINRKEDKVILACIISEEKLQEIRNSNQILPSWIIPLSSTNNIAKYFSFANIFISASRKETFSYTLAEAIYFGLPCITSDISGVQWAKELKSIRFFESENIKALANEIEYLLKNKVEPNWLLQDKIIIKDKFSDDVWCKNILSFYSKII